jgi:hypothetical protein
MAGFFVLTLNLLILDFTFYNIIRTFAPPK